VIEKYREMRDMSHPILDTANAHYMLKHLSQGLGELKVAKHH
jgi:hypothetical protein